MVGNELDDKASYREYGSLLFYINFIQIHLLLRINDLTHDFISFVFIRRFPCARK